MPIAEVLDERAFVNGIVGLLATGGSTNHTLHLIAMARVAGILLTWDDFDELSAAVPLLARVYPNGKADVNQFQAAGGLPVVIRGCCRWGCCMTTSIRSPAPVWPITRASRCCETAS
jgi:phosphogluconate dehydratase